MTPTDAPPTLLYLVSEDWFFWSHRLAVARGARDAGWRVIVACRVDQHADRILGEGFELVPLPMQRGSLSPLAMLADLVRIVRVYRRARPDLVHHVAIKLCLIGTIAAVLARVPRVVNAFTGLGYLFIADTPKARLLRRLTLALLRPLLHLQRVQTVVQNGDDLAMLRDARLAPLSRVALIRGAGVDVHRFAPGRPAVGPPWVVLVCRMLVDKGVYELVAAAGLLRARGRVVRVILVGPTDPENPKSLGDAELEAWHAEGVVEWWGQRSDVPEIWAQASIGVLPSYREGLPKSLLEAGACGLPLVTTDVPGCRELVRHGIDGLLVPPRDPRALADAIACLLDDPERRAAYGASIRARIVAEFSEAVIVGQTTDLYARLLGRPLPPAARRHGSAAAGSPRFH